MSHKNTILICGNFMYPNGNAAGKRVYGLGKIFQALGYRVCFAGIDRNRRASNVLDTLFSYEDTESYVFHAAESNRDWLKVKKYVSECIQIINHVGVEELACIVFYGSPVLSFWMAEVARYAKKRNIRTVFDCVDWIEQSGKGIKNIVKFVDTNIAKRIIAPKMDGVIVISSYLEQYYCRRGCKVVRLPPVGVFSPHPLSSSSGAVRLLYAGQIFGRQAVPVERLKDRVDWILQMVGHLVELGIDCRIDLYGMKKDDYIRNIAGQEKLLQNLQDVAFFHGVVQNENVTSALADADFTILMRSITKVTTAGFPSKVAESLNMGIPVIANLTSDIGAFVKTGENGIVVDDNPETAAQQIALMVCDRAQITRIAANCRKESVFDYRKYTDSAIQFVQKIL